MWSDFFIVRLVLEIFNALNFRATFTLDAECRFGDRNIVVYLRFGCVRPSTWIRCIKEIVIE